MNRTWLYYKDKLQLTDFSEHSQDMIAVQLIIDVGAISDAMDGRLQGAIDKCSRIWASLPASTYPQPKKTYAFAEQAYLDAGGTLCSTSSEQS